jgi:hypothetical protein
MSGVAYLGLMSEFATPAKRSAVHVVRDILGVIVGAVSFPILVSVGHALFGQMGVSQAPSVGPEQDPAAWEAFMQSLGTLELLSATAAHIGGTFLAAGIAMLIAASRTRRPGILLGGFGLLGGVMNAMMLPGQPTWLMILDVALYVPAGWLAAELVLRLKNRVA